MTEAEGKMMQEHFGYWSDLTAKRIAIAVGPVADPKGTYGLAIVETESEAAARDIARHDPAVKAGMGFGFEIYPIPKLILRS